MTDEQAAAMVIEPPAAAPTAVAAAQTRARAISRTLNARMTPTISAREFPAGTFRADGAQLFCNYCSKAVDWVKASSVNQHLATKLHLRNQAEWDRKTNRTLPQTLPSFTAASESRRVIAHEFVKALLEADIPLQKSMLQVYVNF